MSSQEPTYKFNSVDDILNLPDPEFLIEGVLLQERFTVLYGEPGAGKSFLALGWAFALASGTAWQGRTVKKGPVVYLAAEGYGGLKLRVAAQLKAHEYDPKPPCSFVDEPINFLDPASVETFNKDLQDSVGRPNLIIVDTLARCFVGGNENSSQDMGVLVAGVEAIKRETGAALLLIHHSGKSERSGLRGSSALAGAADTIIKAEPGDLGKLTLKCEKQKDAEPFSKIVLLRRTIKLDGGGSSCVLDSFDEAIAGMMPENDAKSEKALTILQEKFDSGGATASKWQRACEGEGIPQKTFYRRLEKLLEAKLVEKDGDHQGAHYRAVKSEPLSLSE